MTDRVSATTAALAAVVLVSGCSFSPISHRIKVGEESFVLFVGEGADHNTDLFALPSGGGSVAQVTFTPLIEKFPRLSVGGEVVAFIRMRDTLPNASREVVMMNLLGGGEKAIELPAEAGIPRGAAWSVDGRTFYVRTDKSDWEVTPPPGDLKLVAAGADRKASVDSAMAIWLGEPRFARAISCATTGICIVGPKGDTTALAPEGSGPIRWGRDSVAWFERDGITVRSLGPGRERRITWRAGPTHAREATFAPAQVPVPQQ